MKTKLLKAVAIVATVAALGWAFAPAPMTEDEANRAAMISGFIKGCEETLALNRAKGVGVPEMERPGYCAREAEISAKERWGFR